MSTRNLYKFSFFLLFILAFYSCKKENKVKDKDFDHVLVINEVIASNKTGILAENDSLYDWIEIKNISDKTVDLHKFALATVKSKKSKKDTVAVEKTDKWKFPEMELEPGGILLVFASERDRKEVGKELHTDFKVSKEKGRVQILSKEGSIMSEVKFDELDSDECYRRLDDGSYEKSFMQTPGFENSQEGYEEYCNLIDEQRKSPLLIWEAHTKSGKYNEPWIELKNVSNAPVNLSEYSLASDPYDEQALQLPELELAPGKTYVVECKEKLIDIKSSKSLALVKGGEFVDGVCGITAPYGVSMGRIEGKKGFFYFPTPTRGSENTGKYYRFIADYPSFNYKSGVYSDCNSMSIAIDTRGQKVHFTTDGSMPTMSSPLYSDSIHIDSTTVFRAFSEGDSTSMQSKVVTATYFLHTNHSLPIVNISVNNEDLFNKTTGIYMPGPNGGGEYPHKGANYWKHDTKRANLEFYDNDESFSCECGLAIFGGFSRALSKKSFKLKFKDIYGQGHLVYDIFKEGKPRKFKNLVLRSGSQDMNGVMVRDEFFTSLMKENSPNLLVQAYRPVALYINAKYFGLYYIREKIDKHFAAHHLNVSSDSINIIMSKIYNEEGPKTHFQSMLSYAKSNDLSQKEHYDYMSNLLDFDAMIDQKLGQIYSGNTDVGNIRYIRSTDEKSDKKWHYVYYDIDISFREDKPISFYLRASGSESEGSVSMHNVVIDRLLSNKEFRQLFLERLSLHLHKTFLPENATKKFDAIINEIRPEMKLNCKRWPKLLKFEKWENNVKEFRKKLEGRNKYVLDGIRKELSITPAEEDKYFKDLGI